MTAKIFRNAFLIGFTVLLACILLFFFIMYSNYQAQAFDNLAIEAEHISEGMQICGGESYLSAVQSGERITWIAADGSVLYDNMADSSTMENHLQRPEVAEAFETGSGRSDRYSSTILEKNNYYALLLKDGTVLRVAGKQTSVAAMALMLVQPSLWIVVLVLVLCGLLAMRLARQIVRPINAINPDNPNATPTYPELQPLISRLQEQNRTIRTQLSELSTRQREFDAITENMREGFLIVDDKCNILSSNRSALRLLGIDGTPKPENLHQAVCSGELLTLVDAALDGTRGDEELSFGGGTWQLYANPVITGSRVTGAILIFMDVTEREQRDYIKYIDQQYNSERLTGILERVTEMIGAHVLHISKQDYDPQGASVTFLIAEEHMKPALEPDTIVAHLDKSHVTVHTYPEYHPDTCLATFRVDIDVATCGEITPLSTLDYLIGSFDSDIITMDYRVRGFTRDIEGKKLFMDHNMTSIQDFIDPATLDRYDAYDINVYQANLFHTRMLLKEIDLQNYLFNTDIYELPPKTRLKIHSDLRREMIEIFSGKNIY